MGKIIEEIIDNEYFEFQGDIQIKKNIGKNASVVIKDGNLTVNGNVDDGANITLMQETKQVSFFSSSTVFVNKGITTIGSNSKETTLQINGNVGNEVRLKSHNANFSISGMIGKLCSFVTHNGYISTGNVGENSSLVTHNGDINSRHVAKGSSLTSHNGHINVSILSENTSAITHNGNVHTIKADSTATLRTVNGSIYENGIKRQKDKKDNSHYQAKYSINNFAQSSKIIVNGIDVTQYVNDANAHSSSTNNLSDDKEPIRYIKHH